MLEKCHTTNEIASAGCEEKTLTRTNKGMATDCEELTMIIPQGRRAPHTNVTREEQLPNPVTESK